MTGESPKAGDEDARVVDRLWLDAEEGLVGCNLSVKKKRKKAPPQEDSSLFHSILVEGMLVFHRAPYTRRGRPYSARLLGLPPLPPLPLPPLPLSPLPLSPPHLEVVFLHVGAARKRPADKEEHPNAEGFKQRNVAAGRVGRHKCPDANGIEEGVEDQAAPDELKAQLLRKEVVRVQVDKLAINVLEDKPGEGGGAVLGVCLCEKGGVGPRTACLAERANGDTLP